MKTKLLLGILGLLLALQPAHAQDSTTCAGLLLKNHISVGAEGMAGAQAALSVDASGAHDFNPAGLLGGSYPRVSATYYRGLVDDSFGALSYDMPVNGAWAVGGTFIYYDAGAMELRPESGPISRVNAQQDFLVSAAVARHMAVLGQTIDLGANVKGLYSTLVEEYSALAAALDLGARYEVPMVKDLNVGLTLKNFGTPMKYRDTADSLPMYALAGAAYAAPLHPFVSVQVAADLQWDLEQNWYGNLGAEFQIYKLVAVRGGYKLGYDLGAITAGIGVCWNNISLDYAFNLMEVMNSVHRVSLGYTLAPPPTADTQALEQPQKSQEEMLSEMVDSMEVTSKPEAQAEKLQAQVLEVRRKGGVVNEVVMDKGAAHGVKIGCSGSLYDKNGAPIAGLVIRLVDPEISLAEVMGLSKDISDGGYAVIEMPAGQ